MDSIPKKKKAEKEIIKISIKNYNYEHPIRSKRRGAIIISKTQQMNKK